MYEAVSLLGLALLSNATCKPLEILPPLSCFVPQRVAVAKNFPQPQLSLFPLLPGLDIRAALVAD